MTEQFLQSLLERDPKRGIRIYRKATAAVWTQKPLCVVDLNDEGRPDRHSRMTQEGVSMIGGWTIETISQRCWRIRENEAEILYRALHEPVRAPEESLETEQEID